MIDRRAPVAVTCGEPAGIGPEVVAKARAVGGEVPFFVIGNPAHFDGHGVIIREIDTPEEAATDALCVLPHDIPGPATPGHPDPAQAAGVISAIARGVELASSGAASAICTAPINKKALKDGAGFPYPGHTEYLAALCGDADVVMMLACPDLRVVPATIHIALEDVPRALTPETLETCLRVTNAGLRRDFGIAAPRIAVTGLNPHAGEGGTMGRQETDWIGPLVDRLAPELGCFGPLPADTAFHAVAREGYDAAVAMYHDQALIPIKTIDFAGGVNVTLGLPFIRTSPDHGTAFDIAGTGQADPTSMVAALRLAWEMAGRRATAPA
ncbi:4-hydroxythreonine-4-phosphate dehydrogenase PdxA [Jannaschia aquimarina]|uniref:4-hydroxythreonine-4-phosphate dehydrogenase n=1 Tax=Jannaschia aquimarina TaxID=935700 RepID=A0A0D1DCZ6_9RHOB|nr:4-hydroxythreonine-4-phosphate dehydrogenase PdxA [Jannaschia aquimarina]KIT17838.1 4-hydroxythreonine-4-phosphate dehydrogenase 1 [Jannaschia aquimarina]SNS90325.1 4-hydroxythreonine-4-phosphate dehydrogenase [Jannaschia aquimarina]